MKKIIPLLVAGTLMIAGCNQEKAPDTKSTSAVAPIIEKTDAVAVVNGQYISKSNLSELEKDIAERSHGQTFPKEKLVEELIQRELLVQDALQKNLDKSPEVIAQLDTAKRSLLSQAALQDFLKANPVTDADVKTEYDNKVAGEKGTEYKARHILVKTEAEAKKLIAQLNKGANFAKLANKHSIDAKESQNGGDLGWFVSTQMVAPFSDALVKLEKGKYTTVPVQTQFGWHVILKEDTRTQTPPPLETVKEQLMPYLQRQKVKNRLESLRKQAKVEILVPLTDEKPKSETTAPAVTDQAPVKKSATEESEDKVAPDETADEASKKTEIAPAEAVNKAKPAPAEPKK